MVLWRNETARAEAEAGKAQIEANRNRTGRVTTGIRKKEKLELSHKSVTKS